MSEELMRLDKEGMVYKGVRIDDAGEAYRAFMAVMGAMLPNAKWRDERSEFSSHDLLGNFNHC